MIVPTASRTKVSPLTTQFHRSRRTALLILAALSSAPLSAQSIWNTTSGSWSVDTNWNPALAPVSDTTTQLVFNATASYTTTNDIGASTFTLNRLTVNNTGTGTVTIAGATTANTFSFAGVDPTLDITGTALFTGLLVGTPTITKTGPGTFIHDSNNTGFTGTIIVDQGTFVNRSTAVPVANFNPVSIVVNNGATYQFGQAGAGDPNLPNSTFVTVNTGGIVSWQEGEVFGGFHLNGGTINLLGGVTASGSVAQSWTSGVLTGGNFILQGNNAITKTTPGTVTVAGNVAINTGTGGLNILEGTVSLAGAANLGTANVSFGDGTGLTAGTLQYHGVTATRGGNFAINVGGGSIDVTSATTVLTLSGSVSGLGDLKKIGPGKLHLAGSLTSTGATTVSEGILQVEPTAAFGNFAVAAGAALAINSGVGAFSFAVPGINLMDATSTLQFDLDTNALPTAPLAVVSTPDGLLASGTPTLRMTNQQAFATGTYTLLDYEGAAITSGFNLSLPGRTLGSLVYDTISTRIDVSITGSDTVKWTGAVNSNWDLGSSAGVGGTNNWKLATAGTATNFIDTDNLTFDDTATRFEVNLTTAVQPLSTEVTGATDYTFSGPGKITGPTALKKSGTGTLILATDNDYTGGTVVTDGAVQIGNGGITGSVGGTVTLNGGTLAFDRSDDFAFANTIALGLSGGIVQNGLGTPTITTPLPIGTNTINFSGEGNLNMGAFVSGTGTINKEGTGTLTLLANNNSFTGTVNVNAGTVLLEDLGAGGDLGAASVVINNGGTFIFGPGGNVDFPDTTLVTINQGGLFRIEQGENFGGVILDGGEMRFISTARTGVNSTGVAAAVGATVYDFRSGTITTDITSPGAGGALNQTGTGVLTKSTPGTVTISGGVTFQNALALQIKEGVLAMGLGNVPAGGVGTITMGDSITGGILQLNGAGGATTARAFTLNTGGGTFALEDANAFLTVTGFVNGPGSLIKAGPGTLVLGNANDYFGGTAILGGTLEVTNVSGSATGSGSVAVDTTLAGNGAIVTGPGQSVLLDGIFQPGISGATQGTDFSITTGTGGSTVFGVASIARFDLWSTTGTDQSTNLAAADLLQVVGNIDITAGATLHLTNPNALAFQDGDVFRLFDWSAVGTLTGTWAIDSTELNLGDLQLDTTNLYTSGTIAITAIPEPGSVLLIMLGIGGLTLRRRRN